jgi:hypothetical protein
VPIRNTAKIEIPENVQQFDETGLERRLLSGVASRSPCEAQPVTSTENICHQVERQSCRIGGETFMFEEQSASIVLDRPDQAILQIAVFRRTASGRGPAATMRVTAPLHELERIPTLLASALEEWLLRSTAPLSRVH